VARATQASLEARALERRQAGEQARLGLAGAERWPDLTLGAGVELHDPAFDVGPQFTFGLTLPFFSRGAGAAARAHAVLDQLALERLALERSLSSALGVAMARVSRARERAELYATDLVPAAREVAALYAESYKEGSVGIVAVRDAERDQRDVESGWAAALLELHTAVAELEREAGINLEEVTKHD
jgi:cobalt-zinc-cadmium efflux system outer membrane protein